MTGSDHSRAAWRKSSYSGQNGNCVEVADLSPAVVVRDSKDPGAQQLTFPAPTWRAFTRQIQASDPA
jgi:hypothetical protein